MATNRPIPRLFSPPITGSPSPWGTVQRTRLLAPGVHLVGTGSHGGIWLSPSMQSVVRERFGDSPWLQTAAWWEEDMDAAVLAVVLASFFLAPMANVPDPEAAKIREHLVRYGVDRSADLSKRIGDLCGSATRARFDLCAARALTALNSFDDAAIGGAK